ncbi:hypothetical protein [Burkholderia pseudomallei]|uniref:hypothetical protein n=1 Tax=Burkholderia pseudomallei TaxID=28450 RepID=UPI0010386168|nr:hypothetical protein [Burkholderia pseudomallei]
MRDELMTEALCWELEKMITAEYAREVKATADWVFYCPHEICLTNVHTRTQKNTYFAARPRHVSGCPDEAPSSEPSAIPGAPKRKPVQVREKPIPNLLGPQPALKQKSHAPTKEELLQLSRAVRHIPALHPGTLEEVVDAWIRIAPEERDHRALTIGNQELTYKSAFRFLGGASDDVDSLAPDRRIIFGAATVERWKQWILVKSRKKFSAGAAMVPLRLAVKQDEAPCWLTEVVDRPATLFWHGVIPELAAKKDAYRLGVDFDLLHAGFTVRAGHLTP